MNALTAHDEANTIRPRAGREGKHDADPSASDRLRAAEALDEATGCSSGRRASAKP